MARYTGEMSEPAEPRPISTRLLLSAGGFVMGLLVGSITTVVHQSVITIAGIDVPWGLMLGLIAVIGFLVGLRIVVEDRLVVLIAAHCRTCWPLRAHRLPNRCPDGARWTCSRFG
jgi:steroid 5-alpha reductase family enzyme